MTRIRIRDPKSFWPWTRDKHPGSATLFCTRNVSVSQSNRSVFYNRIRASSFHSVCSWNQALLGPHNRKVNILLQLLGYSTISASVFCAGIFKQSMGARNRVGIGLSYQPARLHSMAELVPWIRFLGSLKFKNSGSYGSRSWIWTWNTFRLWNE